MLVEFSQTLIFLILTLLKCLNVPCPLSFTNICINHNAHPPYSETIPTCSTSKLSNVFAQMQLCYELLSIWIRQHRVSQDLWIRQHRVSQDLWIRQHRVSEDLRLRLYNALIVPQLTYNTGTWGLTSNNTPHLMYINVVSWDRSSASDILKRLSNNALYIQHACNPVIVSAIKAQLSLFGHVLLMQRETSAQLVTSGL